MGIYETVKTVNGYEIKRMIGHHGCYHIDLDLHRCLWFRTIKAAAEWAAAN